VQTVFPDGGLTVESYSSLAYFAGPIVWAPVVYLSNLQVGTQRVTDLEVLVVPLPGELRVDGILGVNFLERFRPTFEFDRSTLVLEHG